MVPDQILLTELPADFNGVINVRNDYTFTNLPVSHAPFLAINPANGVDPKYATWYHPAEDGIFLFDAISPVSAKYVSNPLKIELKGDTSRYFFRTMNVAGVAGPEHRVIVAR